MLSEDDLEQISRLMEFIQNRVDNVAGWVVDWMPQEDNEKHHNALEHLRRVWEEASRVRRMVLLAAGWPEESIGKMKLPPELREGMFKP